MIWLGLALCLWDAQAGERWVASASVEGVVATPARLAGVGGMAGLHLTPRWTLEASGSLQGDPMQSSLSWGARLETRWQGMPGPGRQGPSLLVGGGLEQATPVASAGLALDVTPRLRTQARYLLDLPIESGDRVAARALALSVGWTFPYRPPSASLNPSGTDGLSSQSGEGGTGTGTGAGEGEGSGAAVAAVPLLERLKAPPPEAVRVWLPHPICAWVPADQLDAILADLPPESRAELVATGYMPQAISLTAAAPIEMKPIPRQGTVLVVAGGGGDQVTLTTAGAVDVPLSLSAEGVAVATVPEGEFSVTISGGGRTVTRAGAVFDGHGTWVVVPVPEGVTVRFAAGSSTLAPAVQAALRPFGSASGTWRYQIRGEASPEGSAEANARLASARAQSAATALIAAGVDPDRIDILPPIIGEQRAAHILPVSP